MNTARTVVLAIAPGPGVAAGLARGTDRKPLLPAPIALPEASYPDADKAKASGTGK